MKTKPIVLICAFLLTAEAGRGWSMAQASPAFSLMEQNSSETSKPGEDVLYNDAAKAIDESRYSQAAAIFNQVARLRGRKASAALYWKAYAENKQGLRTEAMSSIEELRKTYPQSRWVNEAGVLEIEIKRAQGKQVNPDSEPDEDMKLIALNSLMQSDEERAIPMLERFLNGNSSEKLKDRALFVLSQSGSSKAKTLLGQVARGQQHPELQKRALNYLGIDGGNASRQILSDIYATSNNPEIKTSVLHAFMVSGDVARVLAIARQETSPELKKNAVHQLGIMGGQKELRQLYKETSSVDVKTEILHSMGIGGDTQALIEVAKTETDPGLRERAIKGLGIGGGTEAQAALVSMYGSQSDENTKLQIIKALFIQGDAKDLVALARKESNPAMKRELVKKISIMGSREGNDYMMEILNK